MSEASEFKGCRVFIVEDDGVLTMLLKDMLAEMDCNVVDSAVRVNEALRKSATAEFDVALLDLNLRGEQGFAIAESIRERGRPFVIITGYAETSIPDSLRAAPLLQKPYRRRDLAAALRAALRAG